MIDYKHIADVNVDDCIAAFNKTKSLDDAKDAIDFLGANHHELNIVWDMIQRNPKFKRALREHEESKDPRQRMQEELERRLIDVANRAEKDADAIKAISLLMDMYGLKYASNKIEISTSDDEDITLKERLMRAAERIKV